MSNKCSFFSSSFSPYLDSPFEWPRNQSRVASDYLLPAAETPSLSPNLTKTCSTETSILIVVCSAVENVEARSVIRQTWGSHSDSVSVVFLLGNPSNKTKNEKLIVENELYGDILQENFLDSYLNLTVKSLFLLDWFTRTCRDVPFVLKTDDDMFINVEQLLKIADKTSDEAEKHLLVGSLICGAVPIRNPTNKWYSPSYMFSQNIYPNYLSGTAYFMSRRTADALLSMSELVPLFHLEDIYVTGMLSQAANIRPKDHLGFSYLKRKLDPCLYSQVVSSHHLSPEEMKKMYLASFAKPLLRCRAYSPKKLRSYTAGKCRWKKVH